MVKFARSSIADFENVIHFHLRPKWRKYS